MYRFPVVCASVLLALLASVSAPPAPAQSPGTRAYAPDDLRGLNRTDRARVISLEYSEQSSGRRIPDDQLRFYLDQADSGWTFSRIKQDIATSLRGSGHRPGQGGWNGGGGTGQTVRCESVKNRQRVCNTPGWRNASVARQLSGTACVRGRNWDLRNGQVQVDQGCRADFVEARGWGGGWQGGGQADYSVTCSSESNRRRNCAWDPRRGRPVVLEQISGTPCVEGRNWGHAGTTIWVDRGCRARFGVR